MSLLSLLGFSSFGVRNNPLRVVEITLTDGTIYYDIQRYFNRGWTHLILKDTLDEALQEINRLTTSEIKCKRVVYP